MNYIVLDMEWNQSPYGKKTQNRNMPFEIIEIGAVKLDSSFQIISEFNKVIRPQVYKQIHFKTQKIVHLNMEQLNKGEIFPEVIKQFFAWCGKDFKFCTWGPTDLTELQRNMEYYHIKGYIDKPIIYYDIQKLFSLQMEGIKNPHTLEKAVDYFCISKAIDFHSALNDAKYTTCILQRIDKDILKEYYSIDYYHNPKNKKEEIKLIYNSYYKYISREFNTKEEAVADREVRSTICYKCGKRAARKIRWFTNNMKTYYSVSVCEKHGLLKGKIRVKRTREGKIYIVKTLKLIDEKTAEGIREKQLEGRERRREKKRRIKEGEETAAKVDR